MGGLLLRVDSATEMLEAQKKRGLWQPRQINPHRSQRTPNHHVNEPNQFSPVLVAVFDNRLLPVAQHRVVAIQRGDVSTAIGRVAVAVDKGVAVVGGEVSSQHVVAVDGGVQILKVVYRYREQLSEM